MLLSYVVLQMGVSFKILGADTTFIIHFVDNDGRRCIYLWMTTDARHLKNITATLSKCYLSTCFLTCETELFLFLVVLENSVWAEIAHTRH